MFIMMKIGNLMGFNIFLGGNFMGFNAMLRGYYGDVMRYRTNNIIFGGFN